MYPFQYPSLGKTSSIMVTGLECYVDYGLLYARYKYIVLFIEFQATVDAFKNVSLIF